MATFLTTTGVSAELERIVSEAKSQILLISPYLKINPRMKELLADADRMRRDVRIVFGKNELQPDEAQWLQRLGEIKLYFRKNLHAKCYMNEHRAIVTSMNLYEFSQIHNDEMGILVSAAEDAELYARIGEEVQRLIRGAESWKISFERVQPEKEAEVLRPTSRTAHDLIQRFGIKKADLKPEMVEARRNHPRAYESWTAEEETVLAELADRQVPVEKLARLLGRQPTAVERKMKDLEIW